MTQAVFLVWTIAGLLLIICVGVVGIQGFNSAPLLERPFSLLQIAALGRLEGNKNPWRYLDATHPIHVLAKEVGMGARYPLEKKYRFRRFIVLLCPGLLPLGLGVLTSGTAQNVSLMFAGAFFGTVVASCWPRYVAKIDNFWKLSREQDRSPEGMAAVFIKFARQREWVSTTNSGGYTHLGRVVARIKFEIIARVWPFFFSDLMRVRIVDVAENPGSAVMPNWRYSRRRRYDPRSIYWTRRPWWLSFLGPIRLLRLAWSRFLGNLHESKTFYVISERLAEVLLRVVAAEIVKASGRQGNDLCILTLSLQLNLYYRRPNLSRRWVAIPLGQDEPW